MNKAEAVLVQLNSENKRFTSSFDAETRKDRVANTLDKLQSETRVSPCGVGVDVFTKDKKHLCMIVDTVILFPSQEMQDLFTRTLFATKDTV